MADAKLSALTLASVPTLSAVVYGEDSSTSAGYSLERLLALLLPVPRARLTLSSGVPITSSDVTGATTVYLTPYNGNTITLWDGTRWVLKQFVETSLAIGTVTSGLPYDIFGYLSSGTLALEKLAWTNSSTRATAVTYQDGMPCKSGDKTRLHLGTFCSTSTTTTEDSVATRYLSNRFNTSEKRASYVVNTDHTVSTSFTSQFWNTDSSSFCRFLVTDSQSVPIELFARLDADNIIVLVGIDSSAVSASAPSAYSLCVGGFSASNVFMGGGDLIAFAPGAHTLNLLEQSNGSTSFSAMGGLTATVRV